jgi:flagellar biosynthesis chaperone FliJ
MIPLPLDYGDAIAYALAMIAVVAGYFIQRRSKSESRNLNESVDGGVLAQFQALNKRLTKLEIELYQTRRELTEVRRERDHQIEALRETYREALEAKDQEIAALRATVEEHRERINQLEANT